MPCSDSNSKPWFSYADSDQGKPASALVVGAGIAGCQTAWHLAQQGVHVTVLEQHRQIASEASGNIAGVISPKLTATPSVGDSFYRQCFAYTIEQLRLLMLQEPDWQACGVLQLMHHERDHVRWDKLAARGLPESLVQCVTAQQASDIANTTINQPALWFPKAGWIKPKSFCLQLLNHPNIALHTHTEALSFEKHLQQWRATTATGQSCVADVLIIASGKHLDFPVLNFLDYVGVHGQTSAADVSIEEPTLKCVIDHEGYITPPDNNRQLLFGSSYDRDEWHMELSAQKDQDNLAKQRKHLPQLAASLRHIRSSHGAVRITSPDRLPYVGQIPDIAFYQAHYHDLHHGKHWKHYPSAQYVEGLYINTAYASRGLTTAGLCAKYLSSLISGSNRAIDNSLAETLHPARLLIKRFKKASK